jgi:hypothetical protein
VPYSLGEKVTVMSAGYHPNCRRDREGLIYLNKTVPNVAVLFGKSAIPVDEVPAGKWERLRAVLLFIFV